MRVDDDRVALRDRARTAPRRRAGRSPRQQREEPAVGGVDVHAHAVALAQRERLVDRGRPRRARSCPRSATTVPTSPLRARGLDARRGRCGPRASAGDRARLDAEHAGTCARACSGRRRCGRSPCRGAARARPTAPRGWRSSRSTSGGPSVGGRARTSPPGRATTSTSSAARRRPAVERVVVRVDEHRRQVGGRRDRVRRLEHLARRSAGGRTGSCRPSARANSPHAASSRSRVGRARRVRHRRAEPPLPRRDQRRGALRGSGSLVHGGKRR